MKILLTGVSGQVGRALAVPLRALGEVIGAEGVRDADSCGSDGGIGKMVAGGLVVGGEEFG